MGKIIIEIPQAGIRRYVIEDETAANDCLREINNALSSFQVVKEKRLDEPSKSERRQLSIADFQDLPTDEYTPLELEAIRAGLAVNRIMREQHRPRELSGKDKTTES